MESEDGYTLKKAVDKVLEVGQSITFDSSKDEIKNVEIKPIDYKKIDITILEAIKTNINNVELKKQIEAIIEVETKKAEQVNKEDNKKPEKKGIIYSNKAEVSYSGGGGSSYNPTTGPEEEQKPGPEEEQKPESESGYYKWYEVLASSEHVAEYKKGLLAGVEFGLTKGHNDKVESIYSDQLPEMESDWNQQSDVYKDAYKNGYTDGYHFGYSRDENYESQSSNFLIDYEKGYSDHMNWSYYNFEEDDQNTHTKGEGYYKGHDALYKALAVDKGEAKAAYYAGKPRGIEVGGKAMDQGIKSADHSDIYSAYSDGLRAGMSPGFEIDSKYREFYRQGFQAGYDSIVMPRYMDSAIAGADAAEEVRATTSDGGIIVGADPEGSIYGDIYRDKLNKGFNEAQFNESEYTKDKYRYAYIYGFNISYRSVLGRD